MHKQFLLFEILGAIKVYRNQTKIFVFEILFICLSFDTAKGGMVGLNNV